MKKELTSAQVEVLAPIWAAKQNADAQWRAAMTLLGVDHAQINGGDLAAEPPYLLVRELAHVEEG